MEIIFSVDFNDDILFLLLCFLTLGKADCQTLALYCKSEHKKDQQKKKKGSEKKAGVSIDLESYHKSATVVDDKKTTKKAA